MSRRHGCHSGVQYGLSSSSNLDMSSNQVQCSQNTVMQLQLMQQQCSPGDMTVTWVRVLQIGQNVSQAVPGVAAGVCGHRAVELGQRWPESSKISPDDGSLSLRCRLHG